MSGHEPGQVGVVLDDEDARIARSSPRGVRGSPRSPSCIPLRSAPHTASSRPPAGTLADRRPGDPRPRGARPGRPRELQRTGHWHGAHPGMRGTARTTYHVEQVMLDTVRLS